MTRLKYMINNLESPILIHNRMSSIYNGTSSISKNLFSKSTHKSIKTQLVEHRIEWKAILYYKKVDFLFYIYYAAWENLKEIMNII